MVSSALLRALRRPLARFAFRRKPRCHVLCITPAYVVSMRHTSGSGSGCPFKTVDDIPGNFEPGTITNPRDPEQCAQMRNDSGLYKFGLMGANFLNVYAPNANKDVLKLDMADASMNVWNPAMSTLLGPDSFSVKHGVDHRRFRKVLNPLFASDRSVEQRYPLLCSTADTLISNMYSATRTASDGGYAELYPMSKGWAWDVGVQVVLGTKGLMSDEESLAMCGDFEVFAAGILDPDMGNLDKAGTLLGDGMVAKQVLLAKMTELVNRAKQTSDFDHKNCLGTLMTMEAKGEFTYNELLESALLMLWTSHETTSSGVNNVAWALSTYPEQTSQLLDSLSKLRRDDEGRFDFGELMRCEYLDGFVKETLRHVPVISGLIKMLLADADIDGHRVEAGHICWVNMLMQADNPKEFEEAARFEPLRWIEKDGKWSHSKSAFLPFGMGSKMCIGWKLAYAEMKLMTALFAERVRIEIDESRLQKAVSPFNYYEIHGRFHPK